MLTRTKTNCRKCVKRLGTINDLNEEIWLQESVYSGKIVSPLEYRRFCGCDSKVQDVRIVRNTILIDLTHTWKSGSVTGIQNYSLNLAKALLKINPNILFISNQKGVIRKIETEFFASKVSIKLKIFHLLRRFWRNRIVKISIIKNMLLPFSGPIYHFFYKDSMSKESIIPVNCQIIAPESILDKLTVESLNSIQNHSKNELYLCIHDMFPVTHPEFTSSYTRDNIANFLDLVFGSSNIICQTETVRNSLNLLLDSRKIISAPNIFQNPKISVIRRPLVNLEDYQLEKREFSDYFVTIGTIEPRKNLRQVLEVFEELWNSGLDTELHIYGGFGWNCEFEKHMIEDLVHKGYPLILKLNPSTEQIRDNLKKSRGLILASVAEGVGLTPGEAYSFGVPAIVNSIPAVLESYPKEYLSVYNGTHEGLKKAILSNVKSELDIVSIHNMEIITWEKTAQDVLKLMGELK
jgi:glycosyltransferase involved in cell wall biosynthesis